MSTRIATALAVALSSLPLLAHAQGGEGSDSLAYKANEQAAKPLAAHGADHEDGGVDPVSA